MRRVVTAVAVLLVAGAGAVVPAAAEEVDLPGSNHLELRVDRVQRSDQPRVTGAEASEALFDAAHAEAITRSRDRHRESAAADVAGLFLVTTPPWRPVASTEALFEGDRYERLASPPDGETDSFSRTPWTPVVLGLAAAAGAGALALVRRPEEVAGA